MGILKNILAEIWKAQRVTQLLILLSFLITFSLTRVIIHLGIFFGIPSPNVVKGVHVHHLVPGIFLILISGYIGMSFWRNHRLRWIMAVLFGAGAALTIDEFALWLFLDDVYWEKQGRFSIDAIIVLSTLLIISYVVSEVYFRKRQRKIPIFSRFFKPEKI